MSYLGKEPEILRSSPAPTAFTRVKSITSNFDCKTLVYGFPNESLNTGRIEIFEYSDYNDTWTQKQVINGPHTDSYFGHSVDMNWEGDRIIVGANTASNVYVYDWDGSSFQNYSNIIQSPSGLNSDFGYSVCIAKNISDIITIGSPAHNNVFVYQLINDSWDVVFSNIGTDIDNLAPYYQKNVQVFDSANNLITNKEFNRYGEHVKISSTGEYLVVGQPGTVLSNLNSTNTQNYNIVDPSDETDGNVVVRTEFYTFGSGLALNKQLGSVRVFKSENSSWSTSNSQVGNLIYGDRNFVISENRGIGVNNIVVWGDVGWGWPAHGSSCDISDNGDFLVVGAPLYGEYTSYAGATGRVYTYKLTRDVNNNDVWTEILTLPGYKLRRFGLNVKLDYSGGRLFVNGCSAEDDVTDIFDWAGESWYNVTPSILYQRDGTLDCPMYTADGKTLATTRYLLPGSFTGGTATGPYYLFFNFNLTQNFLGNSLFSGYVSTPQLYIGSNNGEENPSFNYVDSKRISFGGTFRDNSYENTTIENRIYQTGIGYSELLLNKVTPFVNTDEAEGSYLGLDIIRLKAQEVHLDLWNQIDANKYEHHPMLVMTRDGCMSIAPSSLDFSAQSAYYQSSVDAHAILDVNGSTYIRNKLNVNYDGRNEILGYLRSQGALFWDTRRSETVDGSAVYSYSWPAPSKLPERKSIVGYMNGNVSYSRSNCAFYFGFTKSGKVESLDNSISFTYEKPKVSLWFKIEDVQSNYNDEIICSAGGRHEMMITTTGIKLNYPSTGYSAFSNYTFEANKWYNIVYYFPRSSIVPTISGSGDSLIEIYINNQLLTLSESGTPQSVSHFSGFRIGGGIHYAYIGMVNVWNGFVWRSPTVQHLYDNGPPDELLSVGGTATIQNKLGVGVIDPIEALEVSGNVHADFFVGDGSKLTNLPSVVGSVGTLQQVTDNGNVTSNTIQFTNPDSCIVAYGNIEANYFIGDGSQLTNLPNEISLQQVTDNGNVTSNTIQLTNPDSCIVAYGNIEANYFIGDGSQLSNIPGVGGSVGTLQQVTDAGSITNRTIQITNASSIIASGNVEVGSLIITQSLQNGGIVDLSSGGGILTNIPSGYFVGSNNGYIDAINGLAAQNNGLIATGNVEANYFIGDGSQLTGITSSVTMGIHDVTNTGNTTSNSIKLTNSENGIEVYSNLVLGSTLKIYSDSTLDEKAEIKCTTLKSLGIYEKTSNITDPGAGHVYGSSIDISHDGKRIVVGSPYFFSYNGGFKVFENSNGTWYQLGNSVISPVYNRGFGKVVSMSADGYRVAVGIQYMDTPTVTWGGGVEVYEYNFNGNTWDKVGDTIFSSYPDQYSEFGFSVSLSGDGNKVAIGSPYYQFTPNDPLTGSIQVFEKLDQNSTWTQLGQFYGDVDSQFGYSVSISYDGSRVAIGAPYANNTPDSLVGQVKIYENVYGTWYLIYNLYGYPSYNLLGNIVQISSDGLRCAVASANSNNIKIIELISPINSYDVSIPFTPNSFFMTPDGNSFLIGGNSSVITYTYNTSWSQLGNSITYTTTSFGSSVATVNDLSIVFVGDNQSPFYTTPPDGEVIVYKNFVESELPGVYLDINTDYVSTSNLIASGIITNNNPRFYAYNPTQNLITSSPGILNGFSTTRVNTGSHYDTSLGRFTAPINGTYEFKFVCLHRYVSSAGSCELSFLKNGNNVNSRGVSFSYVTVTSDHELNKAEIMLDLLAGEFIEPLIYSLSLGTDIYYGENMGYFSGRLLG